MSHVKAGGSSKNIHNNAGQRLGVKRFGGQIVNTGEVLVRQTGSTKVAGPGTFISKDFTIHAAVDGVVSFKKIKKSLFTGKTAPRTQVIVTPKVEESKKKEKVAA
jgi:large subunit ribosomal protein L27